MLHADQCSYYNTSFIVQQGSDALQRELFLAITLAARGEPGRCTSNLPAVRLVMHFFAEKFDQCKSIFIHIGSWAELARAQAVIRDW